VEPGLEVAGCLGGFAGGLEAPVCSVEEEEGFSFDAEFIWEDGVEVPSISLVQTEMKGGRGVGYHARTR
jgi:hypothetical protein